MMNQAQYRKRLEEILDKQFKRLDGTVELPIYNRPTAIDQALQAILSLNEEAIGEDMELHPKLLNTEVWKEAQHHNDLRKELRTIIGKGK